MKVLEKFCLKVFMWLLPAPAAIGQAATTVGDATLETSAKLYFKALHRLAGLEESEAV